MKDWFITQLCRTKVGFQVAYRLGLARPGIDFIDVGQQDLEGADQHEA